MRPRAHVRRTGPRRATPCGRLRAGRPTRQRGPNSSPKRPCSRLPCGSEATTEQADRGETEQIQNALVTTLDTTRGFATNRKIRNPLENWRVGQDSNLQPSDPKEPLACFPPFPLVHTVSS